MTRLLLAVNDNRLADHLAGLIAESDELELGSSLRDPQELRSALPRSDIDAVVVHDRRGALQLIEITRELTVAHPDLGLVLIVPEDSPEVLRSCMQAGARDVISGPIGLEQLETSVMAAVAWTHAVRRRAARDAGGELLGLGRVVTVLGAKGGVGATTVAIHLALAARALGEASVCLVEYDLQGGDLRAYLDLPYHRSVVDLAGVADELTSRHLQETLYTHSSGLQVLLSPQEGEQAELVSASAARNILTAIRTRVDLTIVDAGAGLSEASAIAAEMADTALIVTTPDVVSLRGVTRTCALWERLKVEPPEIAVLLNRVSRKLEVQPDLARRVVPASVLATTVPADFFALESAVNTGIPTTDAASAAMLEPMAAVLGEISALPSAGEGEREPNRTRSIVARLAGESGAATVEFAGVWPMILLAFVIAWQIALVGMTFVFAGHSARAGARALAVGDPVQVAANRDLPGAWRNGAETPQVLRGSQQGAESVQVGVKVPLLVPGVFDLPVTVHTTSGTVIEDQLMAGEQGWLWLSGSLAGQRAITGFDLLRSQFFGTTFGDRVVINQNGFALAPINAPPKVKMMIAAANEINSFPYLYGGCHGGSFQTLCPSYDCSSAVTFVLWAAGLIDGSRTSGQLIGWGAPGSGKWVTIYTNQGHVYVVIAGANFDTVNGSYGSPPQPPTSGPRWSYVIHEGTSGYTIEHPVGY